MKKFAAALVAVLLGITSYAYAGTITTFTGPAGTNPVQFPADQADMNNLINAINAMIGPGLTSGQLGTNFTAGSIGGLFTSGSVTGTFQSQGLLKTGTSLTMGTLLPYTADTSTGTPAFFLTFVDSLGFQSFIPVWH